jgi:hypothetical protein
MANTIIKLGSIVPVSLQIKEGDTNRYVRCWIYDNDGTLLTTADLTHVASGLYVYDTYTMPNVNYIACQYKVFSDAGYSVQIDELGQVIDVYSLSELGVEIIEGTQVSGEVVSNEIFGYIVNNNLEGEITYNIVEGSL